MAHIFRCDLCGKVYDWVGDSGTDTIYVSNANGRTVELELCPSCFDRFRKYINNKYLEDVLDG